MTIQTMFGCPKVVPKNFSKATPLSTPCPALLYGIELEIEGVYDPEEWNVPGMSYTEDGSLRNNGKEFITKPMTYSNLAYCLTLFFDKNKPSTANYSDRTSIHVHTNCQDLEVDQLQSVLLLYQVFERVLYNWIGHERSDNIFCVPWHQTALTHAVLENPDIINKFRNWQKYTGLNLLPLFEQGTIEWRHMNGHGDVQRILDWCQIIGHIYRYALTTSVKELTEELKGLNTSSRYEHLLYAVFQDKGAMLAQGNYRQHLEEGVLDMKVSLMPTTNNKKKSPQPVEINWAAMRAAADVQDAARVLRTRLDNARRIAPPPVEPGRTEILPTFDDWVQIDPERINF